ncbi:ATP-binding protein [Kitasatospora cinereorecta]|uniref:ATP-binding protein n=1 Tax=Kitasatospora cinereorecta TaxID=285560 RepID=A0ABW0V348_9ACTN
MAISSLRINPAEHDLDPSRPPHCRPQAVTLRDAPASPAAVPVLRCFARDAARLWGLPDEAVDRVALVVTELVTNAVLHSDSPDVAVAIEFDGAVVTVEVKDSGMWRNRRSARRIAEDGVTGGRGLDLVERSSTWWRAFLSPLGTRVVACLAVHPQTV